MPRVGIRNASGGLNVNLPSTEQPEGTVRACRSMAAPATGIMRSSPPSITYTSTNTRGNSLYKFNGRFFLKGEVTAVVRIERETAPGSTAFALVNHTTLTQPTVTLATGSLAPLLFATGQPTLGKDEFLFMLDPANVVGANALLKISDAGTLSHWGILPLTPAQAVTVTPSLVAQASKFINTVATDPLDDSAAAPNPTTDWVMSSGDESALSADSSSTVSSNPAIDTKSVKVLAGKDDVVQIVRTFGSNIDLTTFGASSSSDEDFIQFFVRVRRPKHIQSVEIAFDTTAAGDFKKDFFSRELTFKLVRRRKRKKLIGTHDLVTDRGMKQFLQDAASKSIDLTFTEEQGNPQIPVAKNTWSRVTLPKNTFDQSGSPNWATVRAIRFTVHANKEGKTAVFLDQLSLNGGAGMHGDYEYTFTLSNEDGTPSSAGSRSNPPIDDNKGTTSGLRNSVITVKVANVERQAVLLTFGSTLTFDPQTTRFEIWRTVGNGKAYFRCGYIAVTGGQIANGTTFTDTCADFYGLNSAAATTVSGNNTSFAVLDPTEELPLDNTSPNDPSLAFTDMADRVHLGRMWWAGNKASVDDSNNPITTLGNSGNVYYSPAGRLEAVQGFVRVTSGVTDPVVKLVVWNDRLFALTKSSLYEIVGTDEPFIAQRIEGVPGTLRPFTVQPSTVGLLWVGEDGIYKFNGQYAENITDAALQQIFRYRISFASPTADGFGAGSPTTTSRAVAGRHCYMLGLNAGFNGGLVYDFEGGTFRYTNDAAQETINAGAMFYDPATGRLFFATGGSNINEVESQTYPTSGNATFFHILTGEWRAGPGRKMIVRKIWLDYSTGPNGAATTVSFTVNLDGSGTAFTPANAGAGVRTIAEFNVNAQAERMSLEQQVVNARDVTINAMEADIYIPEIDEG